MPMTTRLQDGNCKIFRRLEVLGTEGQSRVPGGCARCTPLASLRGDFRVPPPSSRRRAVSATISGQLTQVATAATMQLRLCLASRPSWPSSFVPSPRSSCTAACWAPCAASASPSWRGGLLSTPLSLPCRCTLTQLNNVWSTNPSALAAAATLWPPSTYRTASCLNSNL